MRAARLAPWVLVWLMALMTPAQAQIVPFSQLTGWNDDDHLAALKPFQYSCKRLSGPEWGSVCALSQTAPQTLASAKAFFEMFFQPTLIGQPPALFTGYYEPELKARKSKTGKFAHPIYARPKDLVDGLAYLPRAQIERGGLAGKGLELAWLDDPVDVFFLHIQGSGRLVLPNGRVMRVGYAGRNGFEYTSVGQELVQRGVMSDSEVSAQRIKSYVRANPVLGRALLDTNPSYIFFWEIKDLRPEDGPIGAMSLPITTLRSIAVDPAFVPPGAPVWVEKAGATPLRRLMIAQDTGGAIKGAQRADIFYGTGAAAGNDAGQIRDGGRMVQLLPNDFLPASLQGS